MFCLQLKVLDLCCLSLLAIWTVLCKYQYLLESESPYTHFCSFHTLLVLASLGWCKYTIPLIFLLCKNAIFISVDLIFQFCKVISANINLTPICEQHGESVEKSCNSSNPLAHSLVLVILFPSTTFLLKTHLTDMQGCPESPSSK